MVGVAPYFLGYRGIRLFFHLLHRLLRQKEKKTSSCCIDRSHCHGWNGLNSKSTHDRQTGKVTSKPNLSFIEKEAKKTES
jgi:hypothetical protein